MRLNKTQKNAIVEDYGRHLYMPVILSAISAINDEITTLLTKEYEQHFKEATHPVLDSLKKLTRIPLIDQMELDISLQPEKLKKEETEALRLITNNISFSSEKGYYFPKLNSLTDFIKDKKSKDKTNYSAYEYPKFNSTKKLLAPKKALTLNSETIKDAKFKNLMTILKKLNKDINEAYVHLNEVSQLVHSVSTDTKLLELIPEMSQFIPAARTCTQLVPAQTIADIKNKLKNS